MRKPKVIAFSVFQIFSIISSVTASDEVEGLKQLTGEEVYQSAGLDTLSQEQQDVLTAWIVRNVAQARAPLVTGADLEQRIEAAVKVRLAQQEAEQEAKALKEKKEAFGLEIDPRALTSIESTIVSKFKGWFGDTTFTLANGQIWRQRSSGKYYYPLKNPEIIITREALGYWMTIKETGARVGVERFK